MKPDWLSIKKNPGKIKPMSTRSVVKKHLKEWNFDKDTEWRIQERNRKRALRDEANEWDAAGQPEMARRIVHAGFTSIKEDRERRKKFEEDEISNNICLAEKFVKEKMIKNG